MTECCEKERNYNVENSSHCDIKLFLVHVTPIWVINIRYCFECFLYNYVHVNVVYKL